MAELNVDDLLRELDGIPGLSDYTSSIPTTPLRAETGASSRSPGMQNSPVGDRLQSLPNTPMRPKGDCLLDSWPGVRGISPLRASGSFGLRALKPNSSMDFSDVDELLSDYERTSSPAARTPLSHVSGSISQPSTTASQSSMPDTPRGRALKCRGVFLGGSAQFRGRNGSCLKGDILCCNSMRCTKCDLKVIQFLEKKWSSKVDYLFFRNNYPNEDKLLTQMSKAKGACAYCCQCSWVVSSVAECIDGFAGELRWVCAGH